MKFKQNLTMAHSAPRSAAANLFSPLKLARTMAFGFFGVLASSVYSQAVVIDDWVDPTGQLAAQPGPVADTTEVDAGTILGSTRHLIAERIAGTGTFNAEVAGSFLEHNAGTSNAGRTTVIWDGRSVGGGNTDRTDVDVLGLGSVAADFGGGSETAGAIDLTAGCPAGAQAIAFLAVGDAAHTIEVEVAIWTNTNRWSIGNVSLAASTSLSVVSIPFGSFIDQGSLGGVEFTNVGAVRLTTSSESDELAADISIRSAVTNCGFDFGDAAENQSAGGAGRFYTTTIASKTNRNPITGQPNNTEPGPYALISGPWLPAYSTSIGSVGGNDTDAESNGQPTVSANGDDAADSDDENGVVLPTMPLGDTGVDPDLGPVACDGLDMGPSEYCASVRVANPTESAAQLVAWIDFDSDGIFETEGCGSSDGVVSAGTTGDGFTEGTQGCERSAAAVRIGNSGLGNFGGGSCSASSLVLGDTLGGSSFATGNIPANCEGRVVVVWDLSETETVTTNATFSRFRITTSDSEGTFFNDSPGPQPWGFQGDGEIEDHILDAETLPVSISAFESNLGRAGLNVSWSTVSETQNAGFYIWGDTGSDFRLLTPDMVPSQPSDIARQQNYSATIPSRLADGVESLVISAIDLNGKEEMYGMFSIDRAYGRESASSSIDWEGIESSVASRLSNRGFARDGSGWRSPARGSVVAADFRVSAEGMQRITYQDLLDAGLDLAGVDPSHIAVTVDGRPVARHIHRVYRNRFSSDRSSKGESGSGNFTSEDVIDFWGEKPALPDSLYVAEYSYRVSVDPSKAMNVSKFQGGRLTQQASFHQVSLVHEQSNGYSMTTVLDDPWYTQRMRADHSTSSYTATLNVGSEIQANKNGYLEVVVAGDTDFPESPDHHVEVYVNDQLVDSIMFDGQVRETISAELPPGLIVQGANNVEIRLPGGTEAAADIVYLDSIALTYSAALRATNNRLLVTDIEPDRAFTVGGMTTTGSVAFAWDGEELVELPTSIAGRGMVRVTPLRGDGYSFWVSSSGALHRPQFAGAVGANDLLEDSANFLIIAHPAFMPANDWESHPMNDFVNHRTAEGWNVALFDVTEIQAQYSGGMALPQAIQRFLTEADSAMRFEHVLLVGGDSYDYNDYLGLGSLSFIPTAYARTSETPHSPSDALLADLNNDGLADKSIGRWPVRTLGDLQSIVAKTIDWEFGASGLESAVWIADSDVPAQRSFRSQAERMIAGLEVTGWSTSSIDRLYFDDVGAGIDAGDYLRDQFFAALEEGRSLTGFVGHGAPSMWTFQGLLTPNDIAELSNDGLPTLIGTMTCYTSYFVSPYGETVAHRWMNGYRVDSQGNRIAGVPNGAVAIHGAATLTNYNQNEIFALQVQEHLLSGLTLGQSIERAREFAKERGMNDLVINWTLLGDPTIRLGGNSNSHRK